MSVDSKIIEHREIEGFPGYRVGEDGTVWTCWNRKLLGGPRTTNRFVMTDEWRELRGAYGTDGYRKVILCANGKRKYFRVNTLILEVFKPPRPKGCGSAHENGDKTDNRLENLSWKTQKDNMADKFRHGTNQAGERSARATLNNEKVLAIRVMHQQGLTVRQISDAVGASFSAVYCVCTGRSWKHIA